MVQIEVRFGGDELAKVLHYYGYSSNEEKIICPFHADINPSMKLDYFSGTYHCFGCEETGNALNFVQLAEKVDDLEACKRFYKILKSNKVSKIKAKHTVARKSENKQKLIEASDYYYCLGSIDWENSEDDAVASPRKYMKERGFSPKTLARCKAKITYNKSYPIIFPMMDNGVFKGWVCRTTLQSIEKKRKYLYNEGFSRSTTLCGTYQSKTVMVVEGYMDMLKAKQFGIKNVVAILGWKITPNQIEKLKAKGVTHIISALDTDECGRKGTKYLSQFFKVTNFQYPEGTKDTGEMDRRSFKKAHQRTKLKIKNGG